MSPPTLTPTDPAAHPGRPRLSPRHEGMLQAMGVNVWWQAGPSLATEPTEPTVADAPARVARPPELRPSTAPAAAPTTSQRPAQGTPQAPRPVAVPLPTPGQTGGNRDALEAAIRACTRCDLAQHRRQAVPGMGDAHHPDWLIVGEAPGEEEDRQGLPFVGRAGQLLDRMLAAMGLSREHKVYIANVLKCRPPHNRNPSPQEVDLCSPYLQQQVALLQPRIVLAMGRFAAQAVLGQGGGFDPATLQKMPLGQLRGQVHRVTLAGQVLPVVVTYHPAYLLRTPADKARAWSDLCLAMQTLQDSPTRVA